MHHLYIVRARLVCRLALLLSPAVVLVPAPTEAATPTPPDPYATHVIACQRAHGFDGLMNPGMHEGRSGWSAEHTCATPS